MVCDLCLNLKINHIFERVGAMPDAGDPQSSKARSLSAKSGSNVLIALLSIRV